MAAVTWQSHQQPDLSLCKHLTFDVNDFLNRRPPVRVLHRRTETGLRVNNHPHSGWPEEGGVLSFDRDEGEKRVISDMGPEGHTESSPAME